MMQEVARGSASAQPVDRAADEARVTPVPVARSRGSWIVGPTVLALCCLGLILFLIAATIVLSLIPVYLSARNASPAAQTVTLLIPFSSTQTFPVGDLDQSQLTILQNYLQQQLNSLPGGKDATVNVVSATAVPSASRKRQALAKFLKVIARILRATARLIRRFIQLINSVPLFDSIINAILNAATSTTTTTTTTTTAAATANSSRLIVRRSLEEGGAPAGLVYVDSHQIAAEYGLVTSVSFYVDQTCALATIEFGAFDLINRNLEMNEAELVLKQRSGPLKLGTASELKSYMNLITIQLCDKNMMYTANGGACKGTKFPVASHQYLGVRSDKCRLGFAPTSTNPLYATTWRPDDASDPFAEPYQTIKYIPSDHTVLHTVTIEPTEVQTNKPIKPEKTVDIKAPRVLFVGSYPPRRCGLAKFLEDLTDSYTGPHHVVAIDEREADMATRNYSDKVIYHFNQTDRDEYFKLANIINTGAYDVLNLQHEYGLFGGLAGEYVLNLLSSVRKPIITTFHTVIPEPTPFFIGLTRAICTLSTRVVVLSNLGRRILIDLYGVDDAKIAVIPHGVPDVAFSPSLAEAKKKLDIDPNTPTMSTFGLIHRNKNIQFALQAMQDVVKSVPNMIYLVIGQTHPIILKYEGEVYRRELEANVSALGLTNNVRFINKFVDNNELLSYLAASDIFLTPYAREDQYVSGTLSWAVGLGKVVVSTPYLYAKELLANGRGFLVPFNDHDFLSSVITKVVQDDDVRDAARHQAYKYGRRMAWPHVAKDLEDLFREELLFN